MEFWNSMNNSPKEGCFFATANCGSSMAGMPSRVGPPWQTSHPVCVCIYDLSPSPSIFTPKMKPVHFSDPHRRRHFEFFRRMDQPHFNICANVDISVFLPWVQDQDLPFTPVLVYLLSYTAHSITPFRWRIRGETIVEHDFVHPSFSIPTPHSEVFSFCEVRYAAGLREFVDRARGRIAEVADNPVFENEPGRDDYLFLSAFPWVSFTGFVHAMHYTPVDSVPRITWGKYFTENGRTLLPLGVQAHHALVDGRDTGLFFQQLQHHLDHPEAL